MLLTLNVSYSFLSLPHFKPQSEKLDGPVAAGKFYGPVAPAVSLKIMHGPRPTLKYAFSGTDSKEGPTAQQIPKKTSRGKKCTAHFGCANMAVSQEPVSGSLYCKEHKPKQVTVQPINIQEKKKCYQKKIAVCPL